MVELNPQLIRNLLSIRYNPTDKPLIKPASTKDFKNQNSDLDGKYVEKLCEQSIRNSIPYKTKSISLSLSSGIDSSLCLALLRKVFPDKKIVCICGIFGEGFDESEGAKIIAHKFDSDFKIVHMDSVFKSMPELINISKRPKWNTYQHLIAKESKKHGKFLVTGDGADEIFGGYTFRYHKYLKSIKQQMTWKDKVKNYLECHNRDWVPDQSKIFGTLIHFNWQQIYNYFKPYFSNTLEPFQQVAQADFNGKLLHDFIPTGKAIYKFYNLDGVPIYLDRKVINFGLSLPINQKFNIDTGMGKLTLRKIAKRLKIKHIDEKKGFSPSLLFDWNNHGRQICNTYLLDKKAKIFKLKLINFDWVTKAFERVENDGDIRYLNRLISILALEIWYRIFVSKDMKPNSKL